MAYNRTTWQDSPSTSTPITAARMNNIETGILAIESGAIDVYTTEAARDAAITSPTEGMRVYLTSPTVPAATGSVTSIPTGVQTIYNGSVWVCITEVASASSTSTLMNVTASYATGWTSGSGDTTNNIVTLTTGTTALVHVAFTLEDADNVGYIAAGVNVSGATTQAAADSRCISAPFFASGNQNGVSGTILLSGLTPGTNTFTLNVRGGSTIGMRALYRLICVRGIA
jgi:hypothetical protein